MRDVGGVSRYVVCGMGYEKAKFRSPIGATEGADVRFWMEDVCVSDGAGMRNGVWETDEGFAIGSEVMGIGLRRQGSGGAP